MSSSNIRSPRATPTKTRQSLSHFEQSENDEIQKEATALSQTTAAYNDLKQKYQNLLKVLSNQTLSGTFNDNITTEQITNPDFSPDITNTFVHTENLEIELQQWSQMWTRLVSMITQVIPYPDINVQTGNDKRVVLFDLVGKLCGMIQSPQTQQITQESTEYQKLSQKYEKSKKKIKKMKVQYQNLLSEVQRNNEKLTSQVEQTEAAPTLDRSLQGIILEIEKVLKKQCKIIQKEIAPQPNPIFSQNQHFSAPVSPPPPVKHYSPKVNRQPIPPDSEIEPEQIREFSRHENNKTHQKTRSYREVIRDSEDDSILYHRPTYTSKRCTKSFNNNRTINSTRKQNKPHFDEEISEEIDLPNESEIQSEITNLNKSIPKKNSRIPKKSHHQTFNTSKHTHHNVEEYHNIDSDDDTSIVPKNSHRNGEKAKMRSSYKTHINQLVKLTNQLRDDYKQLGGQFGDSNTKMSLSTLSKIHDSLVSLEHSIEDVNSSEELE